MSVALGINENTIRSFRQIHGIHIGKLFSPDEQLFVQKYDELKSSRKVGEYFGVDKTTILKYAKKIGYKTKRDRLLSEEDEADICKKYESHTAIELAKEYGVSDSKISQVWHENSLKGKQRRIYKINEHCFDIINENNAYLLGFIAADGCLYGSENNKQDTIRISVHNKDEKILQLAKKVFETDKPIAVYKDYLALEISSNVISEKMKEYGLCYRKTYHNTIADIPEEYKYHFIRGYFDGDGSLSIKPGTWDIGVSISGYEKNMKKLIEMLEKDNIYATFSWDKRCQRTEAGVFGALVLTNKSSKYAFIKKMYENCGEFYLNRKYEIAMNYTQHIEQSSKISDKQILTYYNYAVCKEAG